MKCRRAFTLIELLVVVSVLAVLIAILLPSLGRAQGIAKATKCGAQLNSVGKAMSEYLTENSGVYPPSYWYPNANGTYDFFNQPAGHPSGYSHWSSFLFSDSKSVKAFTCPEFANGGLSRTNPGPNGANWTNGQTDQNGNTSANSGAIEDHQAPFMAFTANAGIIPRNKFTAAVAMAETSPGPGNGQLLNTFVKQTTIKHEAKTILATEFNNAWQTITAYDANGNTVIKSHRPLSAWVGAGGGDDEYNFPQGAPISKTQITDLYSRDELAAKVAAGAQLIVDQRTQLNAVGRNHPGSYSYNGINYGGTTNFIYCDGHVERKNIVETLGGNWEWGDTYYALKGFGGVR